MWPEVSSCTKGKPPLHPSLLRCKQRLIMYFLSSSRWKVLMETHKCKHRHTLQQIHVGCSNQTKAEQTRTFPSSKHHVRRQKRATLTGESKEKAHSPLKTLSPVLGTLMVGMYGTSSSPRSAAIFAFLLLAAQCCGATRAALSRGEDAIFKALRLYIPPARGM